MTLLCNVFCGFGKKIIENDRMNVAHEINLRVQEIKRLWSKSFKCMKHLDPKLSLTYKDCLFNLSWILLCVFFRLSVYLFADPGYAG